MHWSTMSRCQQAWMKAMRGRWEDAATACDSRVVEMFMDFSLFCVNRAKDGRGLRTTRIAASRPVLFHPDYTVGPGIQPGLLTCAIADCRLR
ncbi:hypothetical protein PUN4_280148 [Paraburkholderia unamae]|nr:hypothetical protein PUN4_280148 [Paraburkholderia unamae]